MTEADRLNLEKDVLYEAEKTRRDYEALKMRLAIYGERLEQIGQALQRDPESVTPLPEINGLDYREALKLLNAKEEILELCSKTRLLRDKLKTAMQRKVSLGL